MQSKKYEQHDEYMRSRIRLLHRKLSYCRLGLKCREKWLRRRGKSRFGTKDEIYISLASKAWKLYRILSKLTGQKYF